MPRATRIGRPIRITARMPATTMYSSQVRLKFSASTAWRRTDGDLSPATSSTTRGPRKPSATYAAAKLDRWAAIPQLRSAAGVSGAAGWTAMVGWDISNSPVPVGERVCSMPRTLGAPAPPAYRAHPPLLGGATPRLSGGDEVDQLLDAARQGRLQVGVSADAGQDALPAAGDVRLARVPRATRDPRPLALHGARAARRPGPGACRRRTGRADEAHRLAVQPEPGTEPEGAPASAAVLELHDVQAAALLDAHDRAAPAGVDVLDHQTGLGGDLRDRRRGVRRRQDVPAVAVTRARAHRGRLATT